MTGEEKRQQLKEQYKKELLERKAFLEKAKTLRKMQRINKALSEMESALHDDSDEWINKLNEESALSEAKMEILMEEALHTEEQKKLDDVQMQAEMAKKSAEDLVRQMKRELGLLVEEEENKEQPAIPQKDAKKEAGKETPAEGAKLENEVKEEPKDPAQNKTLGDF
ncbi:MAG: hypothetical protein AAF694_24640 [Bacteroidota bacterium]